MILNYESLVFYLSAFTLIAMQLEQVIRFWLLFSSLNIFANSNFYSVETVIDIQNKTLALLAYFDVLFFSLQICGDS